MKKTHFVILLAGWFSSFILFRYWFTLWARRLQARLRAEIPSTEPLQIFILSSDGNLEDAGFVALQLASAQNAIASVSLVGHSNGARDVLFIAERLKVQGVPVDYLGLIDMTLAEKGAEIPSNVLKAEEFSATRGTGETADFAADFDPQRYQRLVYSAGHIRVATLPKVQTALTRSIKKVILNGATN